jgi:hypothetical protein
MLFLQLALLYFYRSLSFRLLLKIDFYNFDRDHHLMVALGVTKSFLSKDRFIDRQYEYFPNGGTDFGAALTYDFNLRSNGDRVLIIPFVGGSTAVRVASALAEDGAQASMSILLIKIV